MRKKWNLIVDGKLLFVFTFIGSEVFFNFILVQRWYRNQIVSMLQLFSNFVRSTRIDARWFN